MRLLIPEAMIGSASYVSAMRSPVAAKDQKISPSAPDSFDNAVTNDPEMRHSSPCSSPQRLMPPSTSSSPCAGVKVFVKPSTQGAPAHPGPAVAVFRLPLAADCAARAQS